MSSDAVSRHEVWAPEAERVELMRGSVRQPLRRTKTGWRLPALEHGEDYALSVDGGPARPDPRSPHQPNGVHAASRHVDHARFRWTDADFRPRPWPEAIVYELHVGCFSEEGTFDAAIAHLDALASLGITHVELLPVAAFPGRFGWGYDGVSLYAPHQGYGGPDGLKRFVDACHARGLGVILDVVYNHLGPEGNYLRDYGPYFSWRHRTPWGEGMNLDEANADGVRAFICDNAAMWIRDYHVDGLRLDATHALLDTSATHLLEMLATAAQRAGRARGIEPVLIAEQLTNDPWVVRRDHGPGMTAQWCDDFHHAVHALLTGESRGPYADFEGIEPLRRCLTGGWHLDGRYSRYRKRRFGRPLDRPRGGRTLVDYNQNHDQVGNRAAGERLITLCGRDRAHIAAALTILGPGIPMLFMGEELGATTPFLFFADFGDARLRQDVERGRARELREQGFTEPAPAPSDEATYRRSKLDRSAVDTETQALYAQLIELRREHEGLQDGDLDAVRVVELPAGLAMQRGDVVLAFNLGAPVAVPVEGTPRLGHADTTLPTDRFGVGRGRLV